MIVHSSVGFNFLIPKKAPVWLSMALLWALDKEPEENRRGNKKKEAVRRARGWILYHWATTGKTSSIVMFSEMTLMKGDDPPRCKWAASSHSQTLTAQPEVSLEESVLPQDCSIEVPPEFAASWPALHISDMRAFTVVWASSLKWISLCMSGSVSLENPD